MVGSGEREAAVPGIPDGEPMCQNSDVQQKSKVWDSRAEWSPATYLGHQENFIADMKIGSSRGDRGI